MKYHSFISYSHTDKRWAEWLHRGLETYRLPAGVREGREDIPEKFFPVFRDRDELAGASVLGDRLRGALEESRWLVVICSPNAAKSFWVNEEVMHFKRLGRADKILCLIVGGAPKTTQRNLEQADEECFPPAILHPLLEDGSLDESRWEEPLAADARPGADGKRAALLKIIAGMAEVGFGDLVRRDQQRAIVRLRWTVGVVGALVLAFALLGTALFFQKREALRQRDMAREVRDRAQELNTYIIVDLRAKLRDLGRLDLLEDATARVLNYHDHLPPELADDPALLRARAVAMDYAGQQAMSRGDATGAVALLEKSGKAWRNLLARDDAGDDVPPGIATSVMMLAEAKRRAGDLEGALGACENGLNTLENWESGGGARRLRWCGLAAMLMTEKGRALRRLGKRQEALVALDTAASLAKEAVESSPQEPTQWTRATDCFGQLAKLYQEEGDLNAALTQSLAAVAVGERFAEFDLGNATGWEVMEVAESILYDVRSAMGDWVEAEKIARGRLGWIARLRARDPSNPMLIGNEASAHDDLGMALGKQLKIEDAVMSFQQAITLLAGLVQSYPTDVSWREDLAIVFRRRGDLAFDGEIWDVATEDYASSLRMRESLIRLNPADMRLRVMAAGVILAQAEVLQKSGKVAEALEVLHQSERRMKALPETNHDGIFEQVMDGIRSAKAAWKSGR